LSVLRAILIAFSLIPAVAFAQSTATVLGDLQASSSRIAAIDPTIDSVERFEKDTAVRATAIQVAVSQLVGRWSTAGQPELPNDYLDALRADSKIIDSSASVADHAARAAILADVRDDLLIKAAYASRGLGATTTFDTGIDVTVIVSRKGAPVNGLLVRCNPRRHADLQHPLFVFNAPSSPTMRRLPPGNYSIVVQKPDGGVVGRQDAQIGVDNKPVAQVTVVLQ
jgi:hypothetical protein